MATRRWRINGYVGLKPLMQDTLGFNAFSEEGMIALLQRLVCKHLCDRRRSYLGRLIVEEQQKQNDADIDQRTRLHVWLRRRRVEAARLAVPFRSHDQWLKTKNPLAPATGPSHAVRA